MNKVISLLLACSAALILMGCSNEETLKTLANTNTKIAVEQAKEIAFYDANLKEKEDEIILIEEKLIQPEGRASYYLIKFQKDRDEYEYKINSSTGEIISFFITINHSEGFDTTKSISEDSARKIAVNYKKFNQNDIENYVAKYYTTDEQPYFNIYFEKGSYSYNFKIEACTGRIFEFTYQALTY